MSVLPKLDEECFFIAPIGEEGSEERRRSDGVLEYIVAEAANEVGLQAVRADQLAEPGQITLQVIEHILGARAAVADLTFLNPNVFYELAVRHTARLATVLIADEDERLPFDLAQMRTIFFSHTDLGSAARCRAKIVRQLREALDGAVDSPIAASIDLQRLQAGDTSERNIAELVTGMADLSRAVTEIRQELTAQITSDIYYPGPGFLHYFSEARMIARDLIFKAEGHPELDQLARGLLIALQQMNRYLTKESTTRRSKTIRVPTSVVEEVHKASQVLEDEIEEREQ